MCAHVITIAIVILTVDYCDRSELDHPEGCFEYFAVLTERDERDEILETAAVNVVRWPTLLD